MSPGRGSNAPAPGLFRLWLADTRLIRYRRLYAEPDAVWLPAGQPCRRVQRFCRASYAEGLHHAPQGAGLL